MSLTSYRTAPPRGWAVIVFSVFLTDLDLDLCARFKDLAATYSPTP